MDKTCMRVTNTAMVYDFRETGLTLNMIHKCIYSFTDRVVNILNSLYLMLFYTIPYMLTMLTRLNAD